MMTVYSRVALLIGVCYLAVCGPLSASESEQAIEALRAWRRSFVTLEITSFSTCRVALEERFPELKQVEDLSGKWGNRERLRWADFGAFLTEREPLEDGRSRNRVLEGCTATQGFDATSGEGVENSGHWHNIRYYIPNGRATISSKVVGPLYPLWINRCGEWLDAILCADGMPIDGIKIEWLPAITDAGRSLPRFVMSWASDPDGKLSREYWLDPEHGYLPCKVFNPHGKPAFDYEATEFQEVEPGWWFPKRGLFGQRSRPDVWHTWTVEAVVRNVPYQPADFGPPAPSEGTILRMADGEIKRHGQSNTGLPNPAPIVNPSKKGEPITAAPVSNDWGRWLIAFAVLLLLLGGWLRWKS